MNLKVDTEHFEKIRYQKKFYPKIFIIDDFLRNGETNQISQ